MCFLCFFLWFFFSVCLLVCLFCHLWLDLDVCFTMRECMCVDLDGGEMGMLWEESEKGNYNPNILYENIYFQ